MSASTSQTRGVEKKRKTEQEWPRACLTYPFRMTFRSFIKQMLERDKDHARFKNWIGFNKIDSNILHAEFDDKDYWDDYTTLKHIHRIQKYRKQALELGFTEEDLIPKFDVKMR